MCYKITEISLRYRCPPLITRLLLLENYCKIISKLLRDLAMISQCFISSLSTFHFQVPREFSRRAREINYGDYKCSEWRNLLLFLFPTIIATLHDQGAQRLWARLSFVVKACYLPREEYAKIRHNITKTQELWYQQFTNLAGIAHCTYIVHLIGSHLHQHVRAKGPINETSTYPFEYSYARMRRMFKGSNNTLKQVLTNSLLDIASRSGRHVCQASASYGPWCSSRAHDCFVYLFEDGKYQFYKIVDVISTSPTTYEAKAFVMNPLQLSGSRLPFHEVGVFARAFPTRESHEIKKEDIKGKVILLEDAMISVPLSIIQET